ncbi:MAG TPA: ABC transporter permease subunit [Dehalococcoidia bacterium]|nr:ABC transporter permease subunit [Dehalococcoidia bacterium]
MSAVWTIANKEMKDAVRSRWLLFYAVTFAVLALGLAYVGNQNLGSVGFENFSRTTASLINLCLLLVPLIALSLGAGAIAGDQERGTLAYLLAQPLARWELLAGKFAGLVLSVGTATIAGFGLAGVCIAFYATTLDVGTYLLMLGLMLALTSVMIGIGMVVSVVSSSRAQAVSAALVVWFVAVLFFDLVLVGLVTGASLGGRALIATLLLNPVEIVRVLAIMHLEPDLTVLGPFGSYLAEEFGKSTATAVLIGALAVWIVAPISLATWAFNGRQS